MHDRKLCALAIVLAATLFHQPIALSQAASHAGSAARREASASEATKRLPVRRVSLYKNGVGFFEHAGSVTGNQRVAIDLTTAQLNDVLQSLTAVDLNGGSIAGAGYNSTTPLDQQLKALPLALGEDPSAVDFYQAIRGARVEVHSGASSISGRLLNIELRNAAAGKEADGSATPVEKRYITVVGDSGVVRTIELTSSTEVRLLDAELHQDVTRYLQLLAGTRSQGLRHLTLNANGAGTRELRVSYISEVPVWKSTYRLLFGDKSKTGGTETATLQGWAVIDNTVGADWENVQLSLIAGAPQSFIQPISQPYYSRRPEIGLPREAQLTPQTHESGVALDAASSSTTVAVAGAPGGVAGMEGMAGGSAGGILGGIGSGTGSAYGGGTYKVGGGRLAAPPSPIDYEDSAATSISPKAVASAFDDYFEYKLAEPITIRKNESALVPLLQTKVEAERVTLWSPSQPQALRALWVKNTSSLTLDRGSFSIVENGNFGGEGLLDPIHPGERRLLSYAADRAIRVRTDYENNTRRLQQVAVGKGILTERTQEIAEREYLVHNAASEPRDVVVEHPMRRGWELDSEVKPVETTADAYRFRVLTAAGETVRLHIGERHTISQRYQLATITESQLNLLVRTNGDSPQLRQQLAPLFEAKRKLVDLDEQLRIRQSAIDEIANDQKRLRDNLAALKGSTEERALVRRYTGELDQQENKIAALRKEQETLRQERTAAERDLSNKIQSLQLDVKAD